MKEWEQCLLIGPVDRPRVKWITSIPFWLVQCSGCGHFGPNSLCIASIFRRHLVQPVNHGSFMTFEIFHWLLSSHTSRLWSHSLQALMSLQTGHPILPRLQVQDPSFHFSKKQFTLHFRTIWNNFLANLLSSSFVLLYWTSNLCHVSERVKKVVRKMSIYLQVHQLWTYFRKGSH